MAATFAQFPANFRFSGALARGTSPGSRQLDISLVCAQLFLCFHITDTEIFSAILEVSHEALPYRFWLFL